MITYLTVVFQFVKQEMELAAELDEYMLDQELLDTNITL
jgi:hypothetical protein